MIKTYTKKALSAECVQWSGSNLDDIEVFCRSINASFDIFKGSVIIRFSKDKESFIKCLKIGSWIVLQSNEEVRTYDNAKFNLLYASTASD